MRALGLCRIIMIMSTNRGRKALTMNGLQNGPKNGACRGISVPENPEKGPIMARKWAGIQRNGTGGPYFVPPDLEGR